MTRRKGAFVRIHMPLHNLVLHLECRQPTLLCCTTTRHHQRAQQCNMAPLHGTLPRLHMKAMITDPHPQTYTINMQTYLNLIHSPIENSLSTDKTRHTRVLAASLRPVDLLAMAPTLASKLSMVVSMKPNISLIQDLRTIGTDPAMASPRTPQMERRSLFILSQVTK